MININKISKKYKKKRVLDIDSLVIPQGQSFGLVGNNGAGKTTLFRIILDLIKPSEGQVTINKQEVNTTEKWKEITASFIDERYLIDYLTPEEYFDFLGKIYNLNQTDINQFLSTFEALFNNEILGHKKYIRNLSKGNKKKLGVAAALISSPSLILLDEPFENLDPTSQIRLKEIISNFQKNKNITFLISSHDINHVTEICDRIVILENGKVHSDLKVTDDTYQILNEYFRQDGDGCQ